MEVSKLCLDALLEIASEAMLIQVAVFNKVYSHIEVSPGELHWETSESTPWGQAFAWPQI